MTVAEAEEPEGTAREKSAPPPVRATVCGLSGALSVMIREPVLVPAAVGVKVTATRQKTEGGYALLVRQSVPVAEMAKSPVVVSLVMVKGAEAGLPPSLFTVTESGALVVPTNVPGKVKLTGKTWTIGAAPSPVKLAVCGLPGALSVTDKVPVLVPEAVGAKLTSIVQLAPAASAPVVEQLVPEATVKSPLVAIFVMLSGAAPLLVSATPKGLLVVPTSW